MTIDAKALAVAPVRRSLDDLGSTQELSKRLDRDGAVIVTGLPPVADSLPIAAAAALGRQLEHLFPIRRRPSSDGGPVHLHADSFDIVVDTGTGPRRRRDPDEDYVLIQLEQPAAGGGASFIADAYAFADACAVSDPELWRFLAESDVDLYGAWSDIRGVPAAPRAGTHIEYTRTGRRMVRRSEGAAALHRDPDTEHVNAMLTRYAEAVGAVEAGLPRLDLAEGDILVLDNYRCWHGRDAHTGDRAVRILTLRSTRAR